MSWGDRQQVQELRGVVSAIRALPRVWQYQVSTNRRGETLYMYDEYVRWSDIEALIRDIPAAPPRGLDKPGEK
jgi:hypothetical protein